MFTDIKNKRNKPKLNIYQEKFFLYDSNITRGFFLQINPAYKAKINPFDFDNFAVHILFNL